MNILKSYSTEVFLVLGIVILMLSIYLGFLFKELKRQRDRTAVFKKSIKEQVEKRNKAIYESLRTISLAVVQNQCEISEGCLRIKKLMDLVDGIESKDEYLVFNEVYEEIKDFAYLEAREKLTNQEKFRQDSARFEIEEKYQSRVIVGAQELFDHLKNANHRESLG